MTLLRVKGRHGDAETRGIKVMSFGMFAGARAPRSGWRREEMVSKAVGTDSRPGLGAEIAWWSGGCGSLWLVSCRTIEAKDKIV